MTRRSRRNPREETPIQLIVAAYQDEQGAKDARAELKRAKAEKLIEIENAAVLRELTP